LRYIASDKRAFGTILSIGTKLYRGSNASAHAEYQNLFIQLEYYIIQNHYSSVLVPLRSQWMLLSWPILVFWILTRWRLGLR